MGVFDFLKHDPPEDRFAKRVMRRLRARGWSNSIQYDRDEFSLVVGPNGGRFFLGNVYREWRAYSRRDRGNQLDEAIAFLFEADDDPSFEAVADRLVPLVRNLRDLQALAIGSGAGGSLEIWQPYKVLAGPLGVILGIDRPHSMALVHTSMFEGWGCSFETALERATANLVAKSPVRFEPMREGFYVSQYGDYLDSSRLLMPELFRALQVKGEPIAVAISRSCVVVAGSEEPAALDAMAAFVAGRLPQETRPTSFLPLVLKDDDWQAIDPYSHPVDALRDLAIKQAVWDYGIQAGELEAYFEAQGIDVFVAPLESGRFRGDAHTWTSWTEGVPALLPRSEAVGLTSLDGRSLFRSWRDIEEVCGAFKPDTTLHPVRYRPPPWPSTEMWKQVEAHLEPPGWTPSDSELAHESGQIAPAPRAS